MAYSNDWKKMVSARLESHDKKLDKLLEGMSGMKVKVYSVCAAISGIIAYLVNNM